MSAITTQEMSIEAFTKIMDNPQQRDTIGHAQRALKKHLSEYHPAHAKVAIAEVGNVWYKLDGHTRCYLWNEDLLMKPDVLSVDVYACKTKNEACELYTTFDSTFAVETKTDQIEGALNYLGIKNYKTSFMRNCGLLNAIRVIDMAQKRFDQRETTLNKMTRYKKEIQAIADLHFEPAGSIKSKRPGFPSSVVASFLVLYKLRGENCLGFWDAYYYDSGSLKAGRHGAKAARDYINRARKNNELFGFQSQVIHIESFLNAFQFYNSKQPVKNLNQLYKANSKFSGIQQLRNYLNDLGYK